MVQRKRAIPIQNFKPDNSWIEDIKSLPCLIETCAYFQPLPEGRDDSSNPTKSSLTESFPLPSIPPFTARVSNLSYNADEEDLDNFFDDVINIYIPHERLTKNPKGFAYVEFKNQEGLRQAIRLSGNHIHGRPLVVRVAEPKFSSEIVKLEHKNDPYCESDPYSGAKPVDIDMFIYAERRFDSHVETKPIDDNRLTYAKKRPDPFGGAKPVDTEKIMQIDPFADIKLKDTTKQTQRKKMDPFGGAKPVDTDTIFRK
ncbi:hypothetical protein G6F56_010626 [Rhizopus delemar]|nr:hypothetical protein G6F56_010626 [Rhizopus delemar]